MKLTLMETASIIINYEELLRKYVQHVIELEGVDFIDSCPTDSAYEALGYTMFTEQEVEALKEIVQKR